MSMPYSIHNVGTVQTQFDYTTQATGQAYDSNLGVIISLGDKDRNAITLSDVDAFNVALYNLARLALNSTGSNAVTTAMAKGIEVVWNSVVAVNITAVLSANSTADLLQWKDLYLQGLGDVLKTASYAGGAAALQSLQTYIHLEYVQAGNDQLYTQLSSLKEALTATQAAAKLLTKLQNLKNGTLSDANGNIVTYLSVEKRSPSALVNTWETAAIPTTRASVLPANYSDAAKPLFEGPLQVIFKGTNAVSTLDNTGLDLLRQLTDVINQLEAASPTLPGQENNLQSLLINIRNGIVAHSTTSSHPVLEWILDNYDISNVVLPDGAGTINASQFDASKAGDFQKDLSKAVNASTSSNDALSIELQKSLYVLQQFYQSAQGLISAANRIIRSMAQKTKG